jgi:hypothetical protein
MASSLTQFINSKYQSALLLRRWSDAESVGLNGQGHRKQIFRELVKTCAFDAIIETGTFKGDSAAYMAQTAKLPVYTSEVNARFSFLARVRLRSVPNVKFFVGDSRKFLQHLPAVLRGRAKRLFFYLDAHWYADLPLEGELDIIANNWRGFVIMIDDFQVPGDDGYGYDSYGDNQALTFERFSKVFVKHALVPFCPDLPSVEETGFKRGCVVLTREKEMVEKLAQISSLCRKGISLVERQEG